MQVGWECSQCTFVNEPTRPGCEVCGEDRPADYQPPVGVNYKMSDRERQRLHTEQEMERLIKEVASCRAELRRVLLLYGVERLRGDEAGNDDCFRRSSVRRRD